MNTEFLEGAPEIALRRWERIEPVLTKALETGEIWNADYEDLKLFADRMVESLFADFPLRGHSLSDDRRLPEWLWDFDTPRSCREALQAASARRREKVLAGAPAEHRAFVQEYIDRIAGIRDFCETVVNLKAHARKGRKPDPDTKAKAPYRAPRAGGEATERLTALLDDLTGKVRAEMVVREAGMRRRLLDRYFDARDLPTRSPYQVMGDYAGLVGRYVERSRSGEYARIADWEARTAADAEAAVEQVRRFFIARMREKLAYILETKGNLSEIAVLRIEGSYPTFRCELRFEFADGSAFVATNDIIWNRSGRGRDYAQFPTRFHDVVLPGGSKLPNPSAERMNTVFAPAAQQGQEGGRGMRIVAVRGKRDYLVQTTEERGRVVDSETGEVFRAFPIQSILARGYWDDPDPQDPEQQRAMDRVRTILVEWEARGADDDDTAANGLSGPTAPR